MPVPSHEPRAALKPKRTRVRRTPVSARSRCRRSRRRRFATSERRRKAWSRAARGGSAGTRELASEVRAQRPTRSCRGRPVSLATRSFLDRPSGRGRERPSRDETQGVRYLTSSLRRMASSASTPRRSLRPSGLTRSHQSGRGLCARLRVAVRCRPAHRQCSGRAAGTAHEGTQRSDRGDVAHGLPAARTCRRDTHLVQQPQRPRRRISSARAARPNRPGAAVQPEPPCVDSSTVTGERPSSATSSALTAGR